ALPGEVELPAMIGASQTALLVAPEPERHPTMRTEFVDKPVAPQAVAKSHQSLRKEFDAHRRTVVPGQFVRQQRGNPITAEQRAHGCARTGPADEFVLFALQHRVLTDRLLLKAIVAKQRWPIIDLDQTRLAALNFSSAGRGSCSRWRVDEVGAEEGNS